MAQAKRNQVPAEAAGGSVEVHPIARQTSGREGAARLVEREWELAGLRVAVKRALGGRGGAAIVEGPPGVGKTALLDWLCAEAVAGGFRVLRARGGELERGLPYGVVRQFFERPVRRMADEERAEALAGAAVHARQALGLGGPVGDVLSLRGDEALAARHGLYWLVVNLAERRPLLLVLDDAHSVDQASLEFVAYLASRLDGLRVLVCLSAQVDNADGGFPTLARLGLDPAVLTLRPSPLTVSVIPDVLGALLGAPVEPQFAEACHAATGGNPFLLHELASALRTAGIAPVSAHRNRVSRLGPRSVARAVLVRLEGSPRGADRLARSVAVLGPHAEPRHVARLAGVEPEHAARALDALVASEVLSDRRPLEFVHPIVRAAVYHDMRASARSSLHARAAELLILAGVDAEEVAPHLDAAEPCGRKDVVEWLRTAARAALQQGVPDAALRWLRRALSEPPPPDDRVALLGEVGIAAWRAGESAQATSYLREALNQLPAGAQRARVGLVLAQALWAVDGIEAALVVLDRAIADASAEDAELALHLEAELAAMAYVAGRLAPTVRERLRNHEQLPGTTPARRAVLAACACARVALDGTAAQAAALGRRGLDLGVETTLPESAVALSGTYALIVADEVSVPEAILAQMHERAERAGSVFEFVGTNIVRALLHLHQGRVTDAEADARAALEALEANAIHRAAAPPALAVIVEALIEQGRLEDADAELRAAGLGEELPLGASFNRLRHARARLRLVQGRLELALADARAVGDNDETGGMLNPGARWRSVAALACHGVERHDEAVVLADQQVTIARAWGARSFLGEALHVRALVGARPETLKRLHQAASVLERSPARLQHARALVDLASALRRQGRRAQSRALIAQALARLDRCGADALVARAQSELEAMGDRPRPRARSGRDALTPAERRVADLAARQLSNRQIAQTLFLTPKTIENHLGRIYHKLDIHTRCELLTALELSRPD